MNDSKSRAGNSRALYQIVRIALLAAALLFNHAPAFAGAGNGVDTSRGDRMLADYFRAETAKLREQCLADVEDIADWKAKREIYHRELVEMLGLDLHAQRSDLQAAVTGRVEQDDFVVEKVHFQSRPGLYVTGNLYMPRDIDKPAPAILYLCGHGGVKKNGISYGNKVHYQHHGAWFARHGYVCLVIDSLQLGEIESIHHGTYRYKMWWWNSRGYTPAAVEAWNCIRALDYLQTRSEVDAERIGATGRSGGGAYSWWIAAIDERIKAAVPVAGITDLQNHVVDGCVEGHCDCMYILNTYRWDYPLVAALVAPRPLLISNSDKDSIFPLDGVARVHEKVRKIYRLYGAEKNLGLNITEGPHKDTQELRIHAFVWFDRFLKGETCLIDKPAVNFFEPEQLKVFEALPADEINTQIHESFIPKAPPASVARSDGEWSKQREAWMNALGAKVFRGWPSESEAGDLDVARVFSAESGGVALSAYDFTSQPNVRLRFYAAWKADIDKPTGVILKILDEPRWRQWLGAMRVGFADQFSDMNVPDADPETFDAVRSTLQGGNSAIAWLAPRGIGPTAWNPDEKKQTQIRRRFMLLGQTLDGMRVWDVRRTIQAVRSLDSLSEASVVLEGIRETAGLAVYASLFERDIAGLNLWHPPVSHRDRPILLNVLKYLDMPQAVAMAAERTSVRAYVEDDGALEYARDVAEALAWPAGRFETLAPEPNEEQFIAAGSPEILRVGPLSKFKTPSQAAAVAPDGAVIEIEAGIYKGDACVWRQDNIRLIGVGGRAHLRADGASAQGKAIWVIKGSNVTVENIEFSGAKVADRNGAGIRIEGAGLTLRHCYFHDNENGILGGGGDSDILIEFCEFAGNGHGDGYSHNLYIGRAKSLTFRHCYSHHARIGHNLKSRAAQNYILYNRIMDETDGTSSYAVNLPNGGRSVLIGNVIQQGPDTDNSTLVSYGEEGLANPNHELIMVNNTLVNDRSSGTFVHIAQGASARLVNNLFVGKGKVYSGPATTITNLATESAGFIDRKGYDYRLRAESPAVDAGSDPGSAEGLSLRPARHYLHPAGRQERPAVGPLDIGAYEYAGE